MPLCFGCCCYLYNCLTVNVILHLSHITIGLCSIVCSWMYPSFTLQYIWQHNGTKSYWQSLCKQPEFTGRGSGFTVKCTVNSHSWDFPHPQLYFLFTSVIISSSYRESTAYLVFEKQSVLPAHWSTWQVWYLPVVLIQFHVRGGLCSDHTPKRATRLASWCLS